MANKQIDKTAQWLATISRNKTLALQNVSVARKKESYRLEGIVIFENRNGILIGPDYSTSEVIFVPWNSIQEIYICTDNN